MDPGDHERQPADGVGPTSQADQLSGWRRRGSRWWKWARRLLLIAEAGSVLTKHEAPAGMARALVVIGDAVFEASQPRP